MYSGNLIFDNKKVYRFDQSIEAVRMPLQINLSWSSS